MMKARLNCELLEWRECPATYTWNHVFAGVADWNTAANWELGLHHHGRSGNHVGL
jgi:hypothetical protein